MTATLKPDSTNPLRAPNWGKGAVATGQVISACEINDDMMLDHFVVRNSGHIGYGTFIDTVRQASGGVALEVSDVMVMTSHGARAIIRWTLLNGIDPVLKQWLMATDHGLSAVPAGIELKGGDELSVTAVFYPEGSFLNVGFEFKRPRSGSAKVGSFAYTIGTTFAPTAPWVVTRPEVGELTVSEPASPVHRALMEICKMPPKGADASSSYSVVIRSRQFPPFTMVCPDGVERQIPQIPQWLAASNNEVTVWTYRGYEYMCLPTQLVFRRNPSDRRSRWQHLPDGAPALFT